MRYLNSRSTKDSGLFSVKARHFVYVCSTVHVLECSPSRLSGSGSHQIVVLPNRGYNVAAMRLLIKFNLVLILVFGSGVAIAGYLSHRFLEHSAREQVLEQARLMMGAAGGMRTYTSKQVGPLLKAHQQRINRFLPQTVPAYSATEVFTYLRTTYPDYSYKEASLNPTNLRNRAVDWETDIIQIFRNHPELKEFSSERETPAGRVLFLAKPLVVDMPCLQCHSTPDKAPPP